MSNLKNRRKAANFTQRELAERSGVNRRIIEQYEQGIRDINKAEAMTVHLLAAALECNMRDIMEFEV